MVFIGNPRSETLFLVKGLFLLLPFVATRIFSNKYKLFSFWRRVPVVVQLGEGTTDDLQLEILLFPALECHHLLMKDLIIDVLESRAKRAIVSSRKSPDKDLELVKGDNGDGVRAIDYDWLDESIVNATSTSSCVAAALHLESGLQL